MPIATSGVMAVEPRLGAVESNRSSVSWGAVIGGAIAASAITVLLMTLGSAIGLSSVSVWRLGSNPSPHKFTVWAAIWLILVQWLSSALGGYLTGRMRTKWTDLHSHEVFFRDTANGFLTWAVATLIVAGVASFATASTGEHASDIAAGIAGQGWQHAVVTDTLLRPAQPGVQPVPSETRGEVGRLLAGAATTGLDNGDRVYLTQLVAARTGVAPAEAEARVNAALAQVQVVTTRARDNAEIARKALRSFLLFTGIAMLIGAFIACAAAALGGMERDEI